MKRFAQYIKERFAHLETKSIKKINPSIKPVLLFVGIVLTGVFISSCEEFVNPDQTLVKEEQDMYKNWEEYRSAEMGLYSLQQNLVEQMMVLGELRGDLLEITENASPDLREIYNFNIRKGNKYASPVNFYKLIGACNKLSQQLKSAHPEVLDKSEPINNYDRLYGEVLCMRAWAYFNAVRIYGKVPYVHETLTKAEEIKEYVNSGAQYVDSEYIDYAPDGYYNDTIRDTTIVLEKKFLNQKAVIDTFTRQLENNIKAVGVNHAINNNDVTWNVTVWNDDARHVLLGQMYLFEGDYAKAIEHFDPILYNYTSETANIKYGLDDKFAYNNWQNIFTSIDPYEHIYTLWFGKSYQQNNRLQSMFSVIEPNQYMMKPTHSAIQNWESIWNRPVIQIDQDTPDSTKMLFSGIPGDFYRGYGVSYKYFKNGEALNQDTVRGMLMKKLSGNEIDVKMIMNNVDTVVSKYSLGKNKFDHDANFIIYRAADVHLYAAEIYAMWKFIYGGLSVPRTQRNTSLNILNDGSYGNRDVEQMGVRGRVGFADGYEAIRLTSVIYEHDPVTNEITGWENYAGKPQKKQTYLINQILEERARELAFEGERFYDLMRIANRRNDPSFLAEKVASKFSGAKREAIKQKLMNKENWYIDYFD